MPFVEIAGTKIGHGFPPYIVAELSANHNGDINRAFEIIASAKRCGASAIKFQTYTADTMTLDCDKEDFLIKDGLWSGTNLFNLYKSAETPFAWQKKLFDYAREIELPAFSTPFDETAVDLLEDINVPAYKIASFEITDLPLLRYVAATNKPMIISTGLATLAEIEEAVDTVVDAGCNNLVLLHCISAYPAPANQANLSTIQDLERRFKCVVGLSDHTLGTAVSTAAVACGASFIEKHFTLSRSDKGPDSEFSIEPNELLELVDNCNIASEAIGCSGYDLKPAETNNKVFRRSLYFVQDLKKGDVISESSIRRVRPGFGLSPKYLSDLLGKRLKQDVHYGTAVQWELIDV